MEKVQNRATKLVPEIWNLPSEERLIRMGLSTLEERRIRGDLIQIYKLAHGLNILDEKNSPKFGLYNTYKTSLKGIDLKLERELVKNSLPRYDFLYNRIVNSWNGLTNEIVHSSSLNRFKSKIDEIKT